MRKSDIDTPALLLDLDVMEENLRAMAAFFANRPQKLRPHFKTPKTPEIARRQLEAGAIGITASKLGEVEVLSRAGLGSDSARESNRRRKENRSPVRAAAETGNHRHGRKRIECPRTRSRCDAGRPRDRRDHRSRHRHASMRHRDARGNGRARPRVFSQGPLRYRGIMGYEGHAVLVPEKEKRERIAREALTELSRHVEALRGAGFAPEIVSAGGTGTYDIAGSWPDVTEVQAGSYVFMDGAYRIVRPDLGRPALTLLTTVISRRGDRAIVDAGMKSLTNEFGARGRQRPADQSVEAVRRAWATRRVGNRNRRGHENRNRAESQRHDHQSAQRVLRDARRRGHRDLADRSRAGVSVRHLDDCAEASAFDLAMLLAMLRR